MAATKGQGKKGPMRVAVITPYFNTPIAWFRQCHESVRAQTHPCTHILVADGTPEPEAESWDAQHIVLSAHHADYGDTPRAVGSASAIGQGFDAITYLDSDNWYLPDHIESLVALHHETGAPICISGRYFHRLDGSPLGLCPTTDGENFADTSALFFTRRAFQIAMMWAFIPPKLHAIADRIMMLHIRESKLPRAFSDRPTMAYRTTNQGQYRAFGEEPPPGATKTGADLAAAIEHLRRMGGPDLRLQRRRPPQG